MSPDGHAIVSGGGDRTVRLWNADTGTSIGIPLTGHTDAVTCVAFSLDGRLVVSSPDATLRLWPARASTDDLCDKLTVNMSHKQSHDWVSPNIGSQRLGPKADQWEEGFRRLVHHAERHGDARVPASFTVDGYPPGSWVDRPHL